MPRMSPSAAAAVAVVATIVVLLVATVEPVAAARPIVGSSTVRLTDAEKAMLDNELANQRDRRARRPVMRHSPSSADMINAHLKNKKPMPAGEIPRPMSPDDAYDMRMLVHLAASKTAPAPHHRHNPFVDETKGDFSHVARWPDGAKIEFVVDWKDGEFLCGVPADDIQESFEDAAALWMSAGPSVPRMTFREHHNPLSVPSSFHPIRRVRNGVNEFKVYQHDYLVEGNPVLGGVFLWIDKATRMIVEVDGFVRVHDDDHLKPGKTSNPLQWHVGDHHKHPVTSYHLRRAVAALLGHALGMGNSAHTGHAMHGISSPGVPMKLLKGDRDGILALYP